MANKLSEQEICKKEIEFYMDMAKKVEALRATLYSLEFPLERLEKDEKFPFEVEILNEQFKALNQSIYKVVENKMDRAYPKG